MPATYAQPLALWSAATRLVLVAAFLGVLVLLWRRPLPKLAFVAILFVNLSAWVAYVAPLGRLYGLEAGLDRSLAVGMAASTAAGNSPFEHVQVGEISPEPLWNVLFALAAGFEPHRVLAVFNLAPAFALLMVGWMVYKGLRSSDDEEGRWEGVLVVFAVLGLASLSLDGKPPTPPFWTMNFLYKPNHGLGFGLLALALGLTAPRVRLLPLAATLGLLAWVFLLQWAFLLPALVLYLLFGLRDPSARRELTASIGLSALLVAPFIAHLMRGYHPTSADPAARHMWSDPKGLALAVPTWNSLDLGPLLVLGVLGIVCLVRRRLPKDRLLLALVASAWGVTAVLSLGALVGFSPEPDEAHYFLRFAVAVPAGVALASAGRGIERLRGWRIGQGHLLVLALCIPWSFVAYWDPPRADRYFPLSLPSVPRKIVAYGDWIRQNTSPDAVFASGPDASAWIPALAGRRVLLAPTELVPKDFPARQFVLRTLLESTDAERVRAAAARYAVTHLAIDDSLRHELGEDGLWSVRRSGAFKAVFSSTHLLVFEILRPSRSPGAGGP